MTGNYEDFKLEFLHISGINLSLYKETQMKRRINTYIERMGMNSYIEFLTGMKQDERRLHSFISYLTISVTEFNRNPEQWKIFEEKIIPRFKSVLNEPINIWSAACATGEEPYTIAMYMSKYFLSTQYRIIATDLDDAVLERAREGVYLERVMMQLDEDMLSRNFRKTEERKYAIKKSIISQVDFMRHDLLSSVYPGELDIIVCRNATIYFTHEARNEVLNGFYRSLKPGGILFVGNTEKLLHPNKFGFEAIDGYFYKKI